MRRETKHSARSLHKEGLLIVVNEAISGPDPWADGAADTGRDRCTGTGWGRAMNRQGGGVLETEGSSTLRVMVQGKKNLSKNCFRSSNSRFHFRAQFYGVRVGEEGWMPHREEPSDEVEE